MTIEQLRAVHQACPFQPFALHLADGEQLQVPHSEFLSHSPQGRTVIVFDEKENFSIVDLLLVTRLEVPASNAAAAGYGTNGKQEN